MGVLKSYGKVLESKNEWQISFDKKTQIEEAHDDNKINKSVGNYLRLSEVADIDSNEKCDIRGIVHIVGDTTTLNLKNGITKIRKNIMLIDDSGFSIWIWFWGEQASTFDFSGHPVITVKDARVADFAGKSLNSNKDSKVLIDNESVRSVELKRWYETLDSEDIEKIAPLSIGTGLETLLNENMMQREDTKENQNGEISNPYLNEQELDEIPWSRKSDLIDEFEKFMKQQKGKENNVNKNASKEKKNIKVKPVNTKMNTLKDFSSQICEDDIEEPWEGKTKIDSNLPKSKKSSKSTKIPKPKFIKEIPKKLVPPNSNMMIEEEIESDSDEDISEEEIQQNSQESINFDQFRNQQKQAPRSEPIKQFYEDQRRKKPPTRRKWSTFRKTFNTKNKRIISDSEDNDTPTLPKNIPKSTKNTYNHLEYYSDSDLPTAAVSNPATFQKSLSDSETPDPFFLTKQELILQDLDLKNPQIKSDPFLNLKLDPISTTKSEHLYTKSELYGQNQQSLPASSCKFEQLQVQNILQTSIQDEIIKERQRIYYIKNQKKRWRKALTKL